MSTASYVRSAALAEAAAEADAQAQVFAVRRLVAGRLPPVAHQTAAPWGSPTPAYAVSTRNGAAVPPPPPPVARTPAVSPMRRLEEAVRRVTFSATQASPALGDSILLSAMSRRSAVRGDATVSRTGSQVRRSASRGAAEGATKRLSECFEEEGEERVSPVKPRALLLPHPAASPATRGQHAYAGVETPDKDGAALPSDVWDAAVEAAFLDEGSAGGSFSRSRRGVAAAGEAEGGGDGAGRPGLGAPPSGAYLRRGRSYREPAAAPPRAEPPSVLTPTAAGATAAAARSPFAAGASPVAARALQQVVDVLGAAVAAGDSGPVRGGGERGWWGRGSLAHAPAPRPRQAMHALRSGFATVDARDSRGQTLLMVSKGRESLPRRLLHPPPRLPPDRGRSGRRRPLGPLPQPRLRRRGARRARPLRRRSMRRRRQPGARVGAAAAAAKGGGGVRGTGAAGAAQGSGAAQAATGWRRGCLGCWARAGGGAAAARRGLGRPRLCGGGGRARAGGYVAPLKVQTL